MTERQKDRKTENRKTERQKDRKTENRKTERQRDRETERQRDRKTERQRDRETERQNFINCHLLKMYTSRAAVNGAKMRDALTAHQCKCPAS
jgi:hypothetical protein